MELSLFVLYDVNCGSYFLLTKHKTSFKVFVFLNKYVKSNKEMICVQYLLNHNTTNREVWFSSIACRVNVVLNMSLNE